MFNPNRPYVPYTFPEVSFLKLQDYITNLVNTYGGVYWPLDDAVNNPYNRVINTAVATGRNLALTPDFATDTNWAKSAGCTISGGVGVFTAVTGGAGFLQAVCQIGKVYEITFDLVVTSGTMNARAGSTGTGATRSVSGTYTDTVVCSGSTSVGFVAVTTFTGTIDNVSVTELNIPAYNATPSQLLNTDVWNGAGVGAWTASANATLSAPSTTRHDGATGTVLRIARNGGLPNARQLSIFAVGQVYRIYGWWRGDGTAVPRIINNAGSLILAGTASTDWQPFDFVLVATETMFIFQASTTTGTTYAEFDVTVIALETGIRQDNPGIDMNMEALADSGTATAGASTTLTDSGKTWTTNQHITRLLTIVSGTGAGQTRAIASNTSTVITTAAWTVNPDNTSVYQIIGSWAAQNTNVTVAKVIASPHSGSRNLRITTIATNIGVSQGCLCAGHAYLVSGWYRTDGTANFRVTAQGSGTTLSNPAVWTAFSVYLPPSAVTNTLLFFQVFTSTGWAEVDDVVITELPPLVGVPVNGAVLGNAESNRLLESVSFDGVNDLINLYSAQLNSVFNPNEGTLIIFGKVSAAGIWTGGVTRNLFNARVDASNQISIQKIVTNNTIRCAYLAGGTSKFIDVTISTTEWFSIILTWSKSADQFNAYRNGTQGGSTLTGLGTWVGNVASNQFLIGASDTTGPSPWSGFETQPVLLPVALSASEVSEASKLGDCS